MRSLVVVACVLVAVARTASAQPSPQPLTYVAAPPPERTFSLTVSPLHLLFPIVELTGEFRAGPNLGIAGIGGIGKLAVTVNGTSSRFFAAEAGASVRYYATGSFQKGVQLGAEALYVYISLESTDAEFSGSAFGDGLSIGPFVGYKWTGASGFTFDGQLGLSYAATHAQADSGSSTSMSRASNFYPLLNLNIGWSF